MPGFIERLTRGFEEGREHDELCQPVKCSQVFLWNQPQESDLILESKLGQSSLDLRPETILMASTDQRHPYLVSISKECQRLQQPHVILVRPRHRRIECEGAIESVRGPHTPRGVNRRLRVHRCGRRQGNHLNLLWIKVVVLHDVVLHPPGLHHHGMR